MSTDIFPDRVGGLIKIGEDAENSSWRRVAYELPPMEMTVWYTPFSPTKCASYSCSRYHVQRYHVGEERVYRLWMPWTYFFFLASPGPARSIRFLSLRTIMARQSQIVPSDDKMFFLPLPNTSYHSGVTCLGAGRHRTKCIMDEDAMVPASAVDALMSLYFGATWNDDDPMDVRDWFWQHFSPCENRTEEASYAYFEAWEKATRQEVLAAPLTPSGARVDTLLKGGSIQARFDTDTAAAEIF